MPTPGGASPTSSAGASWDTTAAGFTGASRGARRAAPRHFADRYFPGDYKVIPNGVDISRFEAAEPIERWRDGIRNIFFVGRLENRKGVMDLLKAYRLLRKAGCDCRLLLAGAVPSRSRFGATCS